MAASSPRLQGERGQQEGQMGEDSTSRVRDVILELMVDREWGWILGIDFVRRVEMIY